MGHQNLHTHTTFVDGMLTPEAMIRAALKKDCDSIGFSEHSHLTFDKRYSMTREVTYEYIREINALKEKYEGGIEVFLGIEQEYFSNWQPDGFDYVIGSAHYVKVGNEYVTVDAGAKHQKSMVDTYFGGDYYAMAEAYFSVMSQIVSKTNADIIGHFDLVAKYNFDAHLFDEMHPRYINAALAAIDEIMKDCKLFEVNTGAMYRFDKPEPYPSAFFLKEIYKRGGEVILTSDSHDAESICHKFDEMSEFLKECGFSHIKRLTKNGFIDRKI